MHNTGLGCVTPRQAKRNLVLSNKVKRVPDLRISNKLDLEGLPVSSYPSCLWRSTRRGNSVVPLLSPFHRLLLGGGSQRGAYPRRQVFLARLCCFGEQSQVGFINPHTKCLSLCMALRESWPADLSSFLDCAHVLYTPELLPVSRRSAASLQGADARRLHIASVRHSRPLRVTTHRLV